MCVRKRAEDGRGWQKETVPTAHLLRHLPKEGALVACEEDAKGELAIFNKRARGPAADLLNRTRAPHASCAREVDEAPSERAP